MEIVISSLVACLLGSIPSGAWVDRLFFKRGIRQFGSENIGMTNAFHVLRKLVRVTVLLTNTLKGTLTTLLPYLLGLQGVDPLFFGVAAVLGHTFPISANLRSGKAVATSAGMLLAYSPTFFIYSVLIFVIRPCLTGMASLTSMISAVLTILSITILPFTVPAILPTFNWLLTVIAITLITFVFARHHENIQRIKSGTESRLSPGLCAKKVKKKAANK